MWQIYTNVKPQHHNLLSFCCYKCPSTFFTIVKIGYIQRSALIERLTAEKRTPVNVGGQWQQCMQ
jgi:hypothetical protein